MTKKAEEIDTIDKYVNQFHLEHKCDLCDGVGETECDNCGGIGFVSCSPHEVDLLLRKYSREQFTLLNATIASLRSELEKVKKENEELKKHNNSLGEKLIKWVELQKEVSDFFVRANKKAVTEIKPIELKNLKNPE